MQALFKKKAKKVPQSPTEDESPVPLVIKHGKLVRLVSYNTIKFLSGVCAVLLIGNIIFSLKLFWSSVSITTNLGAYINMVSKGDGHILPSLQAIPVLTFLIVDFALMYFTYELFDPELKPNLNRILFMLIMVSLILIVVTLVLLIVIIQHIYGLHEELHNGIIEAMSNYASNSVYKSQIDRLQIEFQCCGSKKYDEWYNITWYDSSLTKNNASDNSQGHTPFSCCAMSSIFPCIHHNIENTGKTYLYTPELNLSVSTHGCYERIRHEKQEVGWGIVGNLFLYIISQGATVICLRFLQTAHYENCRFEGHKRFYTVWLIGCYAGRKATEPPEVPPVPPDLME
ncbi:peripherin-2-like [Anoplophora glabripennis]|uniref:peripherin-2-like n=1 Tax=Anoplophora glabripennis TaxID=217634 RepID=UPI000C75EB95|nr:peripherin-2-like [Anoplophora glabripennis]